MSRANHELWLGLAERLYAGSAGSWSTIAADIGLTIPEAHAAFSLWLCNQVETWEYMGAGFRPGVAMELGELADNLPEGTAVTDPPVTGSSILPAGSTQFDYSSVALHSAVRRVQHDGLIDGLESHLYVVEIVDLGVKLGITSRPGTRLGTHARMARDHGRSVGRVWLSPPHVAARANENSLISSCQTLIGQTDGRRREYLPIDFDQAVAEAEKLPFVRGDHTDLTN